MSTIQKQAAKPHGSFASRPGDRLDLQGSRFAETTARPRGMALRTRRAMQELAFQRGSRKGQIQLTVYDMIWRQATAKTRNRN
jgi:hypothetical protein